MFLLIILNVRRLRLKRKLAVQENALLTREVSILGEANQLIKEKNDDLSLQIERKQRELAAVGLHQAHNQRYLDELKVRLNKISSHSEQARAELRDVSSTLQKLKIFDQDWESFRSHFETVHPSFFATLQSGTTETLSPNDLRHCAYLLLNLSVKETASFLNVGDKAVKMARYRLKKKLGLDAEQSLAAFVRQASKS